MNVRTRLATGLAAGAALTATGLGVASAAAPAAPAASNASPTVAAAASSAPAGQGHRRLLTPAQRAELRRTGHVTVTRHTKKHGVVSLDLQVGRITAASPTSVTVRSRSGYTATYAITAATKVRARGAVEPATALQPGDRVLVVATTDHVAHRIALRPRAVTRAHQA